MMKTRLWALLPYMILAVFILLPFDKCPTKLAFGVPCPGCGLTRACLALFTGQFSESLFYHPLAIIFGPLFLVALGRPALVSVGVISREAPDPLGKVSGWVWGAMAVALVSVWFVRVYTGVHPDPIDPSLGFISGRFFP